MDGRWLGGTALVAALAFAGSGVAAQKKAQPDLRVTALSAPAAVTAGGPITLTSTVRNAGKGVAKASSTRFYLSADAKLGGDLRFAGSQAVKALRAGKSAKASSPLTAPAAARAGSAFLLACADDLKKAKESNEKNNCRARAITVQAPGPIGGTPQPATPTPTPAATATPVPVASPAPDTSAPGAPTLTGTDPASPSATDTTPRLLGTAEAGSTVRVYAGAECSGTVLATVTAAAGSFAADLTVPANATTSLRAAATDAAQNTSACSGALSYVHDGLAPSVPLLDSLTSPSPSTQPTVSGSAEAGATVQLFRNAVCDGTPAKTVAAAQGGTFSTTLPVTPDQPTFVSARALDAAGNPSDCSEARQYVHDDDAPAAPTLSGFTPVPPSPDATPVVNGTSEAGASTALYASAACSGSPVVTDADGGALALEVTAPVNTSTPYSARATDAAGNASACSNAITYLHDDIAPAAPALTGTTPASPSKSSTSPILTGTAAPNVTVHLFRNEACDDTPYKSVATGAGSGFEFDTSTFENATTTFRARAVDAAGNPSACSPALSYVHDSVAPARPDLTGVSPGSPGNDATPDLLGTGEAGATVESFEGAGCPGDPLTTGTVAPAGTFAVTTTAAPNATRTFSVRAVDAAGNPSACALDSVDYLHDGIAPPNISFNVQPAQEANDTTPTLQGTAGGDTAFVDIYDGLTCTGAPRESVTPAQWSAGRTYTVANGSTTPYAAQPRDAAGNVASCFPRAYAEMFDVAESEPNNFRGAADAQAANGVELTDRGLFVAAFGPFSDSDVFRVRLTWPSVLRATIRQANGVGCSVVASPAIQPRTGNRAAYSGTVCDGEITALLPGGPAYAEAFSFSSGGSNPIPYGMFIRTQVRGGFETEPNDTVKTIAGHAVVHGGFDGFVRGLAEAGDVDVWPVDVTAGQRIRFALTDPTMEACDDLETSMLLLGPEGEKLAEDSDSGPGACGRLEYDFETAGRYYVHLDHQAAGRYVLDIETAPSSDAVEREPNNSPEQVGERRETDGSVLVGTALRGTGEHLVDVDGHSFETEKDAAVFIDHLSEAGAPNCLFQQRRQVLLAAGGAAAAGNGTGGCAALAVSLAEGPFTVNVSENGALSPQAPWGRYVLRTQTLKGVAETEANDMIGPVQALSDGDFGEGSLTAGDTDLWRIELESPASIHAQVFGAPGSQLCKESAAGRPVLALLDATGTPLGQGLQGNTGLNPCPSIDGRGIGVTNQRNPFAAGLTAGTYYLKVTGTTATESWPYRLALKTG